jgi:hypothetical protein
MYLKSLLAWLGTVIQLHVFPPSTDLPTDPALPLTQIS